jgi:hypothetical protein
MQISPAWIRIPRDAATSTGRLTLVVYYLLHLGTKLMTVEQHIEGAAVIRSGDPAHGC